MVMNASLVSTVANVSANVCQYIACNPERFSSDQVLYLLFCFPFQNLRRFTLSLWACLCFPAFDSSSSSSSSSSAAASSSGSDSDDLHLD